MILDTHCHLDLYPNPEQVAEEAERHNTLTIAVTNLPSHFEIGQPHVLRYKKVRLALGLHPLLIEKHTQVEKTKFERFLDQTSFIGEIGLDNSLEGRTTINGQVDNFRFVLSKINDRPRFISLHARGAEEMVLELLRQYGISNAVFHWFTGQLKVLDQIIDAGHYLSINPAMINSKKGQLVIERLPRDRVLTETDGPHTKVDGRLSKPSDAIKVLYYLSKLWGIPNVEVEKQVFNNFEKIIAPIR